MGRPLTVQRVGAFLRTAGRLLVRCFSSLDEVKDSPAVSEKSSLTIYLLSVPSPESPGNVKVSHPSCFPFSRHGC